MEEEAESDKESPSSEIIDSQKYKTITNIDILRIIFSRKTAPHAFSLSIFYFF